MLVVELGLALNGHLMLHLLLLRSHSEVVVTVRRINHVVLA